MLKALFKIKCVLLLATLTACTQPLKTTTREYPSYGFLNANQYQSKNVCYAVSIGNIVWSVILFETIIAPVYFVGFDLFNPVREKTSETDECGIDSIPEKQV